MKKNIFYRNENAINALSSPVLTLDNCLTNGDRYSAVFAQGLFQLANGITRLHGDNFEGNFVNYKWLTRMLNDAYAKGYVNGITEYDEGDEKEVSVFRSAFRKLSALTFDQKSGRESTLSAGAQDAVARLIGFAIYLSKDYDWGGVKNPVESVFENIAAYSRFMTAKTEQDGWNSHNW